MAAGELKVNGGGHGGHGMHVDCIWVVCDGYESRGGGVGCIMVVWWSCVG